jgi:hypothetical protein
MVQGEVTTAAHGGHDHQARHPLCVAASDTVQMKYVAGSKPVRILA